MLEENQEVNDLQITNSNTKNENSPQAIKNKKKSEEVSSQIVETFQENSTRPQIIQNSNSINIESNSFKNDCSINFKKNSDSNKSALGLKKLKNTSLEHIETSSKNVEYKATLELLQQIRNRQGAGILVDVGHSCSHIIPFFDNQVLSNSVRRAEVGGKLISKFLMESVSLTQYNLSKHFFLVTDLKEKCCQTLSSPEEFLDIRQRPSLSKLSRVFYTLNDYEICQRGGIVPNPTEEQLKVAKNLRNLVSLQLERVIFPEILFQPSV